MVVFKVILALHVIILTLLNVNIQEKFENTTEVLKMRKSKKDRQYNGQTKKDKRTN